MTEWFRTSDWGGDATADFEARLRRSRSSKAQILRVKAIALWEAGDLPSAEALLRRMIELDEYANETAFAHERLGDLCRERGDAAGAEAEYRAALRVSPNGSGTTSEVPMKLAELLSERGTDGARQEALTVLDECRQGLILNASAFRWLKVRAVLLLADGRRSAAGEAAESALRLVDAPSQFSRHPGVGVPSPTEADLELLRGLARR